MPPPATISPAGRFHHPSPVGAGRQQSCHPVAERLRHDVRIDGRPHLAEHRHPMVNQHINVVGRSPGESGSHSVIDDLALSAWCRRRLPRRNLVGEYRDQQHRGGPERIRADVGQDPRLADTAVPPERAARFRSRAGRTGARSAATRARTRNRCGRRRGARRRARRRESRTTRRVNRCRTMRLMIRQRSQLPRRFAGGHFSRELAAGTEPRAQDNVCLAVDDRRDESARSPGPELAVGVDADDDVRAAGKAGLNTGHERPTGSEISRVTNDDGAAELGPPPPFDRVDPSSTTIFVMRVMRGIAPGIPSRTAPMVSASLSAGR